jgi:2-polyprenyl-3-methyl-5-hydroxy-6-metoxy-1,4-benzoquinol methylase
MGHECNKFIINDGVFVRDFDEMYKEIDDPWDQKKNESSDISSYLAIHSLLFHAVKNNSTISNVLDIGCADGYHKKLFESIFEFQIDYYGTDISTTIINKAKTNTNSSNLYVDDIREYNESFYNNFDIVYSSRTLYYVAPEIDQTIDNISKYIKLDGIFCFIYNQTKDAFSKKWLTYEKLRIKLILNGFKELMFIELDRYSEETVAIGIFKKVNDN